MAEPPDTRPVSRISSALRGLARPPDQSVSSPVRTRHGRSIKDTLELALQSSHTGNHKPAPTAHVNCNFWCIFMNYFFNTWKICGSEWLPPPCVNRDRGFTFFFPPESFLDQQLMPCSSSAPKFHTLTIIILTVFSIMLRKCQYSPMT